MTDPQYSGTCEQCGNSYEVWAFDEHGTVRFCGHCHQELQNLDRTGLPQYTKPLNNSERKVIEVLQREEDIGVWESEWKCNLHW